jgi:hypothetical protein
MSFHYLRDKYRESWISSLNDRRNQQSALKKLFYGIFIENAETPFRKNSQGDQHDNKTIFGIQLTSTHSNSGALQSTVLDSV